MTPTFPQIEVRLSGEDGNVFAIIGRVTQALRQAGYPDDAAQFAAEAMDCGSYDEVLRLVMLTVETS